MALPQYVSAVDYSQRTPTPRPPGGCADFTGRCPQAAEAATGELSVS